MTERDPRDRLQALRLTSERIASNLLELEGDDTVAMLDAAALSGTTAQRWNDARLRLAGLFAAHCDLKDLIERADRIAGRRWGMTTDQLHELEKLVTGPSIVVSDTTVRLPERGLLAESRRVVRRTADELIAEMSAEFDAVRSVVVGVCQVWDQVIPLLRWEREREVKLVGLAATVGVDRPDLVTAGAALRSISELALSDPLEVDVTRLDAIGTALDSLERELAELQSLESAWPQHVADAQALFGRAICAGNTCAEAVTFAGARIATDPPLAAVTIPAGLAGMLESAIAIGDEDRLSGGADLIAFRRAIAAYIDEADAITVRCAELIDERYDLRARLDAFAAKADRLRMLENAEAVAAFELARTSLYTAPTDLRAAAELVTTYQRLLAAGGGA